MTQLEIPIIHGFRWLPLENKTVPNRQILIELLRPGANPNSFLVASDTVPNFHSQLLLKNHSNRLVNNPINYTFLKPFCEQLQVDFDELYYHLMLTDYINYFFLPIPNISSAGKDVVKLKKAAYMSYKEDPSKLSKEFKESIPVDSVKKKEIKEILNERFPNYRLSNDFISAFDFKLANNLNWYLERVEKYRSWIEENKQERLSNYRLPEDTRHPGYKRLLQCPYCLCWFESLIGGNGKLRSHCGQKGCKQAWDRLRKINKKVVIPTEYFSRQICNSME